MHTWQRLVLGAIVVVGVSLAATAPARAAVTPPWSTATTDQGVGSSDFDTGTLTFPAVQASSIYFALTGNGYYHDHGGGCSATVEVRLDTVWTLIFTSPVSNGADLPLAAFPAPLATFPTASLDGIRVGSTCPVGNAYHEVPSTMVFAIDGAPFPSNIPTMSEWGLMALVSLMLVAGGIARRRAPAR
jgi:hypothetical protein